MIALVLCITGSSRAQTDSIDYLARRYDQNTYLTTHNAMSSVADKWLFPNQTHNITRQLSDGVRALMLDLHEIDDEVFLVHSKPFLGKRPLVDGLNEIRQYIEAHPKTVITIIFESYVSAESVLRCFKETQLTKYIHQQEVNKEWPTLNEMIRNGKRLVLFSDKGGGQWSGYHDVWQFCTETHFSVKSVNDFSFKLNRGKPANQLLILNHFLTNPVAATTLAQQANSPELLYRRLEQCKIQTKKHPTFVVVDFYEIGETLKTVDRFVDGSNR